MKTCGIDLKGNDAILVSLEGNSESYTITNQDVKKISLKDPNSQDDVKEFYNQITEFFNQNNFDQIGIKARATKGKFAGGPTSFKMEGLIQNTNALVSILPSPTIKSKLKNKINNNQIDLSAVNKYQEDSLYVALFLML